MLLIALPKEKRYIQAKKNSDETMIAGKSFKRWLVSMWLAQIRTIAAASFLLLGFILLGVFSTVSTVLLILCLSSWIAYNVSLMIVYLVIPNIRCRGDLPSEFRDEIKTKHNEKEWFIINEDILVCSTSVCRIRDIVKITRTPEGFFSVFNKNSSPLYGYAKLLFGKRWITQFAVIESGSNQKHFILLNSDETKGNEEFSNLVNQIQSVGHEVTVEEINSDY